jgi:arylsulfatase
MSVERPNILWICTDQQRYDSLGCYGNDHVDTDALNRFADSGVRFERAYCQNPVCTPSRASFLTGRYPRTTRCRQNGQPIPEGEVMLPRLLSEVGYTTGLVGKLHVSPTASDPAVKEPARRVNDGYGAFEWSPGPGSGQENAYTRWLAGQGVEYDPEPLSETNHVRETLSAEYHHTTWCADRASEFIETAGDSPWFYSVNMYDPHPAYEAPPEYLDRYRSRLDDLPAPNYVEGELTDKPQFQLAKHEGTNNRGGPPYAELDEAEHQLIRAAYFAMCDLIDDAVDEILTTLERTGQREETFVVFSSDHGTMLGDHGMYAKGPYFYEGAVRVPLVVDGPDVEGGRTVSEVVELVDLAPSLLEAAGEPAHPGMQGESLWSLLQAEGARTKETAYCEFYNASTQHTGPKAYATMVRDDRYKLVRVHGEESGELYDLRVDPDESVNRWDSPEYRGQRNRLLLTLADRMAATADPLPERKAPW